MSRYVSRPRESCSSQRSRARPPWTGWTCASPKPGRDGPAAQLDDPRPRPDVRRDRRVRPDGHDPSVAHGDGRRPASGGIHRGDAATGQDEVGGLVSGHRAPLGAGVGDRGCRARMTGRPGRRPAIPCDATARARPVRPAAPSPSGASSNPSYSNAGVTMQPTSVHAPSGRADCQAPAGTTTCGVSPAVDVTAEPMASRPPRRRPPRSELERLARRPLPDLGGIHAMPVRPFAGGEQVQDRAPGRSPAAVRRSARHVSTNQPPSGCGACRAPR